jgi:hypothetical protein
MSGRENIGLVGEDYARFAKTKTFGSLDGPRAIAILAVLGHHHANNAVPAWTFTTRGVLGVDLFFTISAFLIVTSAPGFNRLKLLPMPLGSYCLME